MNTRRDFLKLGALLVPAAVVAPRIAYSFLHASPSLVITGVPAGSVLVWGGAGRGAYWLQVLKEKTAEYRRLGWLA